MRFALVGHAVGMAASVAIVQAGGIVSEDRGSGYLPYLVAVPANRVWISWAGAPPSTSTASRASCWPCSSSG